MSASVPGRAVYDNRLFYWWNAVILSVMLLGGVLFASQQVRDGGLVAIAPVAVWFAVVTFIAWKLLFSNLYRLETDDRRLYWRRRGKEVSADLPDVASITARSNVATVRFRDDRHALTLLFGGGFRDFVDHVTELEPSVSVEFSWSARMTAKPILGNGFSRP